MATTKFVQDIGDSDQIRNRFTTDHNDVAAFTVQYEVSIGDGLYPVVRYDTAHGFAHRDCWIGTEL